MGWGGGAPRVLLDNNTFPGWGAGGGMSNPPPPSDPDLMVGKKESLQKEVLIWLFFGAQTYGLLGSRTPPPPTPPLKENSGGARDALEREKTGGLRPDGLCTTSGPDSTPASSLRFPLRISLPDPTNGGLDPGTCGGFPLLNAPTKSYWTATHRHHSLRRSGGGGGKEERGLRRLGGGRQQTTATARPPRGTYPVPMWLELRPECCVTTQHLLRGAGGGGG